MIARLGTQSLLIKAIKNGNLQQNLLAVEGFDRRVESAKVESKTV